MIFKRSPFVESLDLDRLETELRKEVTHTKVNWKRLDEVTLFGYDAPVGGDYTSEWGLIRTLLNGE